MKILKLALAFACMSFMQLNTPNLSGSEIMKKNDEILQSKDEQVELTMILVNSAGKERIRKVQQYVKRGQDNNRSSMIKFLSPADVKGTAFLSIENSNRDDDQWLYLPALQKVRRISASNETDNFIGSDFTFEDLKREELDQFTYKLLGTAEADGKTCYHIEATPNNGRKLKESGYSKRELFVSKDNFMTLQMKFYNKNGEMFKVYKASDIKLVGNTGKWRAYRMELENIKTKNKTILQFQNYIINKGVNEEVFTQRYLEKAG